MKSKKKLIIVTLIVIALFSSLALGTSPLPGTESDPVVTASYVESRITEVKNYIDQRFNNLDMTSGTGDANPDAKSGTFKVIELTKNQMLIGMESTEIILRSGTAVAIDNGVDGVSDITLGKDLKGEENIQKNHLLIVPRSDGRGLLATSQIWVMVKGDYQIK